MATSWFSDWGTASWQEYATKAADKAREWTARAAKARGWADYWSGTMAAFVDDALDAVTDGTAAMFWTELLERVDAHLDAVGEANCPEGWVKLRNAFADAVGAAERVEEGRAAGTVSAVVEGTVDRSVKQVKKAVDPRKSMLPWIVGTVAVAFLFGRK